MTIEDAIKHCRDTALSNAGNAIAYLKGGQKMLAESCEKCAAEHEQLAKWLEELKQRRDAEPARKGWWIPLDRKTANCSRCGWWQHAKTYHLPDDIAVFSCCYRFCTACGARMDGGAENG